VQGGVLSNYKYIIGHSLAVPGVQPDMVVISAGGEEGCLLTVHHGDLKAQ